MCLCSALQQQELSNNEEWVASLDAFLTQLDVFLSSNEVLASRLPFKLKKREVNPKPPEGETRIAKIYEFDPTEYHTRTLLKLNIEKWTAQPSSFTQRQEQLVYNETDPEYTIIFESLRLQQLDAHSCILRRFQSVALYRQRARQSRKDDAETISRALFPLIHPLQSPEDGQELQDLMDAIETLIQAGPRYDNIAKRLGLGSLFLLGDVISNNIWEKWLPLNGERFERAMEFLSEKGIVTIGGSYNQLGEEILAYYKSRLPEVPLVVWMDDSTQGKRTRCNRQRRSAKRGGNGQKKAIAPASNLKSKQVDQHTTGGIFDSPESCTETESGALASNSYSIESLLDAADHIAGSTQTQQLPSVRSSSIADRTDSIGPESSVPMSQGFSDQPQLWSSEGNAGPLELQGETFDLLRKRRRVDSALISDANRGPIEATEPPADVNLQGTKAQDARRVASGTKMAMTAEVDKLESTLGGWLFENMDASHMRQREKDRQMMRFTDTVRLHVAYNEGEDFKLEVWLCSSIGKAISQATMGPVEDLRDMLGDYLYDAMNASNWRKEEERRGMPIGTGAIDVSFHNGDHGSDCKVEVMVNFEAGLYVWAELYPR
ncbi:hypothetical protein VE00_10561 [Pseudogymnoascus sp. WSF 3629]|nr:hypothetical protein VE00_10561 [Pseudogymnoascus sp. WSF 3629]